MVGEQGECVGITSCRATLGRERPCVGEASEGE